MCYKNRRKKVMNEQHLPVLSPFHAAASATPFGNTKTVAALPYAVSHVVTISVPDGKSFHKKSGGVSGLPGGVPVHT